MQHNTTFITSLVICYRVLVKFSVSIMSKATGGILNLEATGESLESHWREHFVLCSLFLFCEESFNPLTIR